MTDWFNPGGWDSFVDFWAAAVAPRVDGPFLALTARAALTTVSLAVLGTVLALLVGALLAPFMCRLRWEDRRSGHAVARFTGAGAQGLSVGLRGWHELVWGLALTQVLGLDPIVAVLAIGLPFGGVTARVFADMLDTAAPAPGRLARASGGGRWLSVMVALVPAARADLASYAFYRLECALRSAAILGLLGLGGLGAELALSFQSLHFDEVWTFIWALVIIGGVADRFSAAVRRRATDGSLGRVESARSDRILRAGWVVLIAMVPAAWWWTSPSLSRLWSSRSFELGADLAARAWPPRLPGGGWAALLSSSVDTLLIAALAIAFAATGAFVAAFAATSTLGGPIRLVLLVARAVPPPVWAYLMVLVFLPGILPGALALGVYNFGVLGRLQAEVVENHDRKPSEQLRSAGAGRLAAFGAATVPLVWPRFRALGFYRWEVAVRESVTVGVAGATGLGRDLSQQLAARSFDQATTTVLALLVLTLAADRVGARRARDREVSFRA